jgi:hypothetical protein
MLPNEFFQGDGPVFFLRNTIITVAALRRDRLRARSGIFSGGAFRAGRLH